MTRISYKISGSFGAISELIQGDSTVTVSVTGASGTLKIGDTSAAIKGGKAMLSLSHLPDGIYSPKLYTKSGEIQLESIRKLGEKVTRCGTDRNLTMNMLCRIEQLESTCDGLCTRLTELDKRVRGNGIFG
jgi:hypothetical protein